MANDLSEFLKSIPTITRYWFVISLVVPLLGRFGFISAQSWYLDWELIFYKWQVWRPFTALAYYPVTPQSGFHWIMMIYFLYSYSKSLERETYAGRPADYLYMLIICWLVSLPICCAVGVPFLLEPMVMTVLYIWCQINRDTIVSFWFGMRFKALYFPWILCAFNAVIRGGGYMELVGIFVGHVYYFLVYQFPLEHHGPVLIRTPQFLYNLLPNEEGGIHTINGSRQETRQAARRRDWGAGVALGGN